MIQSVGIPSKKYCFYSHRLGQDFHFVFVLHPRIQHLCFNHYVSEITEVMIVRLRELADSFEEGRLLLERFLTLSCLRLEL